MRACRQTELTSNVTCRRAHGQQQPTFADRTGFRSLAMDVGQNESMQTTMDSRRKRWSTLVQRRTGVVVTARTHLDARAILLLGSWSYAYPVTTTTEYRHERHDNAYHTQTTRNFARRAYRRTGIIDNHNSPYDAPSTLRQRPTAPALDR